MEYDRDHLEQFGKMLKKDVRDGDLDAGLAESYASYFGLTLNYTYTARIQVTFDVTFEVNPDADPDDVDSSDFDIEISTNYCSSVSEITDYDVTDICVEDIEEA